MKRIYIILFASLLITGTSTGQQKIFRDSLSINTDKSTFWWTGIINDGYKMPLKQAYKADLKSNYGNQAQPLVLSSKGEVIWAEQPYEIKYITSKLMLKGRSVDFEYYKAGENLKDAYSFASKTYFPPSGKMPDKLLFTNPQYNTWIELV